MLCINAVRYCRVLLLCLFVCAGCSRPATEQDAGPPKVTFTDFGLQLDFARPARATQMVVRRTDGALEQELPLAGERRTFAVPFAWEPGQTYTIEIYLAGSTSAIKATAPDRQPVLSATLEAPWGQGGVRFGETNVVRALVPENGKLPFGIVIENLRQVPSRVELELRSGPDVELQLRNPLFQRTAEGRFSLAAELNAQHDHLQELGEARVDSAAEVARVEIVLRRLEFAPSEEQSISLELRRVTDARLRALVEPGEVVFPCDPLGHPQPERQADTVVLPDAVWLTVRRWLQPADAVFNFHGPYATQGVPITNRSEVPLNLVVESEVVAAGSNEPLLDFSPPAWASPRESATAQHLLRLASGETASAVIPVFVRPEAAPGDYVRRFRVSLAGSSTPLYAIDAPLRVIRGNPVVATVAAAALVTSTVAWLTFAVGGRRWIGALGTTSLATIGMLAALHFAVSFGSRVVGDVIAAVTGPFAVFLAGIGNEGLTCLVLAALVVLVPRPGTVTVSSLTVFLLNAMFSGQFGLLDVVFVTVSIVCNEVLLALSGVTSRRAANTGTSATLSKWSQRGRTAAAIGIANGLVLFAQFCLMQLLVRLFFATWYVTSVALVVGLLYGTIGALAGAALGQRLRSTAR